MKQEETEQKGLRWEGNREDFDSLLAEVVFLCGGVKGW